LFTKPSKDIFDKDIPKEWFVRFWLWDSKEHKISGESILEYSLRPEKEEDTERYSWENCYISECYIDYEYERIVIRPKGHQCHFIYNFHGKLLVQTENATLLANEEDQYYSKFLNENLFFAKNNKRLVLYQLDKLEHLKPNSVFFFGLTKVNFWQGFNGYDYVKFYYDENLTYFVFLAWEYSAEGSADRSTLFIYNVDSDKETAKFISKFMFDDSIGEVKITNTDLGMNISFQHWKDHKLSEEKTEIHLPKCLF
jgi:hypothetical protein